MARFPIKAFKSHGYYCINSSLIEVQFSDTNEAVRYRITMFNSVTDETTVYYGYWQPVRYDKMGRAYIKDWHGNKPSGTPSRKSKPLYMDLFLRTHNGLVP